MNDRMSDMDALVDSIASHVLFVGADEDGPNQCGCGLVEPVESHEANDAKVTERWWAAHAATAIGLPALLERVEAAEGEGCDCTVLCSMGSTCPGGILAGLEGSGCWRTGVTE